MVVAQLGDDRRQAELRQRRNVGRDGAEGGADAGVLAIDVDAESAAVGRDIGEVQVVAARKCSCWFGVRISVM